jgi:hypothetical protein
MRWRCARKTRLARLATRLKLRMPMNLREVGAAV